MVAYRRPTRDVDVVGRRGRVHLLLRRLPDRFSRLFLGEQGAATAVAGRGGGKGLVWLRGKERKTIAEDLFSLSRRGDAGCCDVYAQQQPPSRNQVTLCHDKTSFLYQSMCTKRYVN